MASFSPLDGSTRVVQRSIVHLVLEFPSDINSDVSFDEGMSTLLTNRPDFIPMALLEWVVILGILVWVLILGCYLFLNKPLRSRRIS